MFRLSCPRTGIRSRLIRALFVSGEDEGTAASEDPSFEASPDFSASFSLPPSSKRIPWPTDLPKR